MRVVPYQEILKEKFERQKRLLEMGAQVHSNGHCFHYGSISFGCRDCFTGEQSLNLFQGSQCMCSCPYCYYEKGRREQVMNPLEQRNEIAMILTKLKEFENYRPGIVSICSTGETLNYIDIFERYGEQIYPALEEKAIRPYTFLYTNGILCNEEMLLRLQKLGVNELRFHLSASHFSEKVLAQMKLAGEMGFILTVEEPSYPLHKEGIMKLLPEFEALGVKHLDLVEVNITQYNKEALQEIYPGDGYKVYKDYFYQLYDNGMVYDIMEEVIEKGYSFSVLDCNSGVERCRNLLDQNIFFDWESVEGMCAPWDSGEGFLPRMKNGEAYQSLPKSCNSRPNRDT